MPTGIYVRTEETKRKMRLRKHTEESNLKNRVAHLGKKHSEETKRKIGLKNVGRKHTEETKKRISLAHKGHLVSEETRKKLSLAHIGKPLSKEHRRNIGIANTGKVSGMKGKKNKWGYHTEKTKEKIRKKSLNQFKDGMPKETKNEIKKTMKRLFEEGKLKIGIKGKPAWNEGLPPEQQPMWLGGISKLPYAFEFNEKLKEQIRKRDNFTCQLCYDTILKNTQKRFLTCHHIDYNKLNSNPNNLITLCNFCNISVNKDREDWTKYFQDRLKKAKND